MKDTSLPWRTVLARAASLPLNVSRPSNIDAVKKRLIAEGVAFVSRQKLDRLTKTVVPEATVDDPLVRDPIRLVGHEVNEYGVLLRLNREPNGMWIYLYQNQSGVMLSRGMDFRKFPINGKTIQLRASGDHLYQQLINETKKGIESTNLEYAQRAEQDERLRVAQERSRLQQEAQAERRRHQLRDRLTI